MARGRFYGHGKSFILGYLGAIASITFLFLYNLLKLV